VINSIAANAIKAYGGEQLWNNIKSIEAEVSFNGLAFTLKRRPSFKRVKIEMEVERPFSKITPIGKNPDRHIVLCSLHDT
jgi:hypothetical protein